jgi:hypothetical protein
LTTCSFFRFSFLIFIFSSQRNFLSEVQGPVYLEAIQSAAGGFGRVPLEVGDKMRLHEPLNDDWLMVTCRGVTGRVPARNVVEMVVSYQPASLPLAGMDDASVSDHDLVAF